MDIGEFLLKISLLALDMETLLFYVPKKSRQMNFFKGAVQVVRCQDSDTTDDKSGPFAPSTAHLEDSKGFPELSLNQFPEEEAPKGFPIHTSFIKH